MRHALVVGLVWSLAPGLAAETKVVVLPIQASGGTNPQTAQLLTDRLTTELGKRTDLKVLGTSEIQNLITVEQQKQVMGCTDNSCLAELGAAMGADLIASGTIGSTGSLFIINLQLVDAKKASSVGRVSDDVTSLDHIVLLMPYLAGQLTKDIPGGPPPPPRPDLKVASAPNGTQASGTATSSHEKTPVVVESKKSGGGGTLTLVRRIAGGGVAGVGALMLGVGVVIGLASVGYLLAGWVAVPVLQTLPGRVGGFGIAGVADVIGVVSVIVILAGVVIAAIP